MKEKDENSRRKFLKFGLTLGAGSLAAAGALHSVTEAKGKTTKALSTDGKLIDVPVSDGPEVIKGKVARHGIPNKNFVMVVDLARCKNARKCIDACQVGHELAPDQEWMKVLKMKDSKEAAPYWMPKPCFHCDKPSCVDVCPVGATYKRDDGLVLVDNEVCIGCKYCMVACPYSARTFNWRKPELSDEAAAREYSPETAVPQKLGTVGKCVFCADLTRNGELPRCVSACPMGAIYFGDLYEDSISNGSDSKRFSELMVDKAAYRLQEHFGTEPRVYYLPPVNRMFPFEEESAENETDAEDNA